jgi:hypothetical protein
MKTLIYGDSTKTFLLCVILACLTLLLYRSCLDKYFAMEDFLCISWVEEEGFEGVAKSYYTDNAYGVYRPTSIHIYYYLCRQLFGLDPLGYHAIDLISHTINVILVFALALLLSGKRWVGFLAGTTYMTRLSHYIAVFWVSGISEVWAVLFSLLSLISFVLLCKHKNPFFLAASLVSFALALTCKESAVTLPFVLLCYVCLFSNDFSLRRVATRIGPFMVVLALYLVLKLVILKPMVGAFYEVGVGAWSLRNLVLYSLWQVNALYLSIMSIGFFTDISPYRYLGDIAAVWSVFSLVLLLCLGFLCLGRRKAFARLKSILIDPRNRVALFGLAAFFVSLAPALLLKNRLQEYYLSVPSIGFSLFAAAILGGFKRKWLAGAFVLGMVVSNILGFALLDRLPDGRTSVEARDFLVELNEIINSKEQVDTIYVRNGTTFLYQVLWNGEAFNSFLNRPVPVVFDFQQAEPPVGGVVVELDYDGRHLREIAE